MSHRQFGNNLSIHSLVEVSTLRLICDEGPQLDIVLKGHTPERFGSTGLKLEADVILSIYIYIKKPVILQPMPLCHRTQFWDDTHH